MHSQTLAPAATLVLYGKVPDLGWRRGTIILAKNGLPKTGVLMVSGREMKATHLTYQIRTYVNRQAQYVRVGTDYREACALLERMQDTRQRETLDAKLGIALPKSKEEIEAERVAETKAREAERNSKRKKLSVCAAEYLSKKVGLSRHSTALYRCIPDFVKSTGKTYIDEVTERDVVSWVNGLKAEGYAQRTCQTRYSTLRGWLSKYGVNLAELIDSSEHRKLNKKGDPHTEPYDEQQLEKLFATCDQYQRVVFTLLLMTGFREQEATNLTWQEIKWQTNNIVLQGEKTVYHPRYGGRGIHFKTKTGKGREVPLFTSLKKVLEEWRSQNPKTIYVIGTDGDLPATHLLRTLKRLAARSGLNCGHCKTCGHGSCQSIFLHRFRHTFAHTCLDKFSIHQVSKWMGHSSVAITAIYLTGTPKDATVDPFAIAA